MSDLLRIGTSGLLAYQRALSTTSHNIANIGVEGFSRQRVELSAQTAGSPFGAGVTISGISRLSDVYANSRLVDDTSGLAQQTRMADIGSRIDQLLSDAEGGLGVAINDFFTAAGDLEADPAGLTAREVLIGSADRLAARVQTLSGSLSRLDQEVDQRAQAAVAEANRLVEAIARVNRDIGLGGGQVNDLLDERDRLLNGLSEIIGVRTTLQDGNQLNVYSADGQALVLTNASQKLSLITDPADSSRMQLAIGSGNGRVAVAAPVGGELGGLFAARTQLLDPVRAELGGLVGSLAQAVNAAQAAGSDLDGQPGVPLFDIGTLRATANANNGGSASVAVQPVAAAPLPQGDFALRYSGGSFSLTDLRSGESVALSGSGSAGDPLVGAGLSLVVSGTPAEGDRFLLRPGADALAGFRALPVEAREIAAAGSLQPRLAAGNSGSLQIVGLQITDPDDPGARSPATISFDAADTYRIDGGPAQVLGADGIISGPGFALQVSGVAAAGDSIQLDPTASNSRDSANAGLLAGLARSAVSAGGLPPAAAYADLVAGNGVRTQQAESARDAFSRLQQQDLAAREATSGVNLDEEAANLLRLQQAFQAAAQVISTADTLFQTLLGAVRR